MEKSYESPKLPNHPEFRPPPKRHPVASFFSVLFVVLFIAAASYATYVWEHKKVTVLSGEIHGLQSTASDLQQKISAAEAQADTTQSDGASSGGRVNLPAEVGITLDSGAVSFSFPQDWVKATAANLNTVCVGSATASAVCQDVATVVPSSLNNDNSAFSLSVKVFQNTGNTTAKDWFINNYGGSLPVASQGDQTSAQNINGYSGYYFLQDVMPTYKDVYYVIAGHGHSVVLYARVYESAQTAGQPAQDFTQYLLAIQAFANSIKFEGN